MKIGDRDVLHLDAPLRELVIGKIFAAGTYPMDAFEGSSTAGDLDEVCKRLDEAECPE